MPKFKANVIVMLKPGILDVQGKTVENALKTLDLNQISNVKIGKYITFDIDANTPEEAHKIAYEASDRLLHNPNIEKFDISLHKIEG